MGQRPLTFSDRPVGRTSLVLKRAAEKKQELLGEMTVGQQRAAQRRLYQALPLPSGVEVLPGALGGVPCEWLWRPESHSEKVIVYLHGGSWVTGDLDVSRPTAAMVAAAMPFKVVSVDYRLAPEHPFPAGLEDCRRVWGALLEEGFRPENVALFGDSAGGNLCLALVHLLQGEGGPGPCALGLISPVTDLTDTAEMVREPLPLAFAGWQGEKIPIWTLYAGARDRQDPLISPVCGDLGAFPPTLIHVGGDEPLVLDCAAFAKKAAAQGVKIHCKIWREMYHDFTLTGPALRESRLSLGEMGQFYQRYLGRGATPRRPLERQETTL